MNIRKGFLKSTLVLSILVGALTSVCHERFFDKVDIDITLPENWQQMSAQEKLGRLGGLLSKNAPFPLLSEIKQFKIRRQLKSMIVDKKDEVLRNGFNYRFGFRFRLGWEELSLLGLAGFASVWILYVAGNVIFLLIPHAPMIHFSSFPLGTRIESLKFDAWRQPTFFPSVKITLFRFLVLEEGPKRPAKPGAVWID